MPKPLTIEPHLQVKELQQKYRNSSDPISRSHHQIIWLLAQGKSVKEVAEVTCYTTDWIYKLARRYNQKGEIGLGDHRHFNRGGQTLLNDVQLAQLWQVLQTPPADGGIWNSRKVADYMSQLLDKPVSVQRGWDYLKAYELKLKVPRPAHSESDPFIQEEWKKNSRKKLIILDKKIIGRLSKFGVWMNIE